MKANKSQSECQPEWDPQSSNKGSNSIWSQLLLMHKWQWLKYAYHNDHDQIPICSTLFDCQWLTQAENCSQGYRGAKGNKAETCKKGWMSKIDDTSAVHSMSKQSELVKYSYCTLLMTIEVQFYNSTFLPYVHH